MRISTTANHHQFSILLLGLMVTYFPGPLVSKGGASPCCNVKNHNKAHKCSNGTPCNEQCNRKICGHPHSSKGKVVLTKHSQQEDEYIPPKPKYPKLEGKEECYNYRRPGKKINCECSHTCDLEKGDPKNRYIVPGAEDAKCSNHCKKHMCKCKTKCQT